MRGEKAPMLGAQAQDCCMSKGKVITLCLSLLIGKVKVRVASVSEDFCENDIIHCPQSTYCSIWHTGDH